MSNEWLGPVAEVKCGRLQWAIPRDDYKLPTRFLNNDTHPLYDQAALDAAVAAERERCAKVCEDKGPELLRWWGDGQANAACQECATAIRGA